MLRRTSLLMAVLVVVLPACQKKAVAIDVTRNDKVPVRFTIRVRGALNVTVEQNPVSYFLVRRTKSREATARGTQMLATQPVKPIPYGEGAFVAGIGIIPYTGDGSYTIKIGTAADAADQAQREGRSASPTSGVKILWWPTGDLLKQPDEYQRLVRPCKVVVKETGTKGTATCPDIVGGPSNGHVSLTLSWVAPAAVSPGTSTSR
jgi:hypothetical protein